MKKNESQESKTACPVCEHEISDELIVDLRICNNCSHIFKCVPESSEHTQAQLHLFVNPVDELRSISENMTTADELEFVLPTMSFYGLELHPNKFYTSKYNHYFNQMSLMILLIRCGLTPLVQINKWNGDICETRIKCIKESKVTQ